jgi:hypothetical protein
MSKKLLIIIILSGILLVGGYFFIRFYLQKTIRRDEKLTGKVVPDKKELDGKKVSTADLRPLFIKRLQLLVNKSSDGLYDLSIGNMQVDVFASTASLQNVSVQPNSHVLDSLKKAGAGPGNIFSISFKNLLIDGINLDDAVTSKTMDYKLVKIIGPVIEIRHHKTDNQNNLQNFSQNFLKQMTKLFIKNLIIDNGRVIVYNDNRKMQTQELHNVQLNMHDILIDSATRESKDRFLFAKEANISFKNFSMPATEGLYHLKIDSVMIRAPEQSVSLSNLSFTSPYNKQQFEAKQKFRRELYHLVLPSVTINNIDWWKLLNQEEVVADKIQTKNGQLSIYLDRSLPPHSKMGNFPNQLLMKIPIQMKVQTLNMSGLNFTYEEYNPVSKESGKIYIDNINLSVHHVSNVKQKRMEPMMAKGSGLFMHKIPLNTEFSFDMNHYKSGIFSCNIKADGFDGTLINNFAKPLGLVKIENGVLEKVRTTISGDQWKAHGDVLVLYKDLKLSLLEKDKGKKELDKKDVTTFVANNFVLKENNPAANDHPRREKAEFKRIPDGGFFMLVWKTMMVGVLKTIGAPEKIASKTVDDQQKK